MKLFRFFHYKDYEHAFYFDFLTIGNFVALAIDLDLNEYPLKPQVGGNISWPYKGFVINGYVHCGIISLYVSFLGFGVKKTRDYYYNPDTLSPWEAYLEDEKLSSSLPSSSSEDATS
jgi:hypothetical protein